MTVKRHRVHWDITAEDQGASRALQNVEENLKGVNGAAERMARTFRTALVATALIGFTREAAKAAMEAEQQQARLAAVVRATGRQFGETTREVEQYVDALAETTQFDDEGLRAGATALLKFGNIQGEVFREGLALSADLAAFMGTDVAAAAQTVGRALQSPTEGIRAFEQQFGKLEPAIEKHINDLAEQGKALEAQNAVLELFRQRIGGVASEMNTGLTKATSDVAKAWGDMLEAMGKTELIGGTLIKVLRGIADVLNDIGGKSIKDTDPWRHFNVGFAQFNEEIEALEARLSSAHPLDAMSRATREATRARVEELKRQRSALLAQYRTLRAAAPDIEAFEAGLNPAPKMPVLGGGKSAAERAAEEQRKREKERREIEERTRKAQAEMAKMSEELVESLARQAKGEEMVAKAIAEVNRSLVESAELADERANSLVYTWDAAGNRIEMTKDAFEEMVEAEQRALDAARDIGLTFTSAFEDAIVQGENFRDVLRGIEQDIVRIIARKFVTEPLINAVGGVDWGSIFAGVFTGGAGVEARAGGGDVAMGRPYIVGEDGPELFVPGRSGTIVPNGAMGGGVTFHNTVHIDSRTDRAEVAASVEAALRASEARILRSFRSGGAFARAAGLL